VKRYLRCSKILLVLCRPLQFLDVKVLGTSFNIKDVKEVRTAEVAVLTGKVWVNSKAKDLINKGILLPFEKIVVNKHTGQSHKSDFTSSAGYYEGTEYNLNFVNAPLDSIINRISAKFNVVINLNNEDISQCKLSGDFTDQPLTKTIDIICKTIGAECTLSGRTLNIKGIKCK
jgi:ferric-dicitrate binding protein FerR (iron transport regulator)